MRRKFIAGNWKMNLDRKAAVALAEAVAREADKFSEVDLAVCPPACYLDAVGQAIKGSRLALGAQNVYFEPNGAFTGEISVTMLSDLGVKYVILGHSERRTFSARPTPRSTKKSMPPSKPACSPYSAWGNYSRNAKRAERWMSSAHSSRALWRALQRSN